MEQNESILEDISTAETEAPYGQRLLTNIIDWIIEILIIVAFYVCMPRDFLIDLFAGKPVMKYAVAFIIIFGYRLLCILAAGKTIGMAVCKTKYLNSHQQPLSAAQKLTAVVAIKTAGIKYYKA